MKTLLIVLSYFFCVVSALVYSPKITKPDGSTKWRAGGTFTVTWDPNSAGAPIPNDYTGTIMLGYLLNGDKYNEHLQWTLAEGFKLNSGSQQVTLPSDLETRTSYIIVLFGDSGNASPQFTIKATRS
ncbi:hypothetical protein BGW37DRAFT_132277 [Umbelopsis sp. PMI_123]|nr:hypothetical protein BGW37DRAFT_132277 [Umbelopsis sp. PMI_123]